MIGYDKYRSDSYLRIFWFLIFLHQTAFSGVCMCLLNSAVVTQSKTEVFTFQMVLLNTVLNAWTGFVCIYLQDRTRTFDMHSLENSLIDIMRAENDSLKGKFRKRLFPAVNAYLAYRTSGLVRNSRAPLCTSPMLVSLGRQPCLFSCL